MTLSAPIVLLPILKRWRLIDVPNTRSSHEHPAIRGVGLAPLFAIIAGFIALLTHNISSTSTAVLLVVLAVSVAAGLLGFWEDVRGLPVKVRAATQVAIGLAGASATIAVGHVSWWYLPVFALGIAAYINVGNFMDGVNGISGMHGFAVGAFYAGLGFSLEVPWLLAAGSITAVAFAGFLPWNLLRSGTFLGDVGSYLLGGTLAMIAVAAISWGIPALVVLGPLAIYLVDVGATLMARIAKGEKWYEAHRSHAFQRLTDVGLTHLTAALTVTIFGILTGLAGLLTLTKAGALASAVSMLLVALVYLALPHLLSRRVPAGRGVDRDIKATAGDSMESADWAGRARGLSWAVIGGTGFVGTEIVRLLSSLGARVEIVVAPRLTLDVSSQAHQVVSNAEESPGVEELTRSLEGCDVIINAAGLALSNSAQTPELMGANALLPVVTARAAVHASAQRFVHVSSAAVQGRKMVLDESMDLQPFSPYSRSKALGERALHEGVGLGYISPHLEVVVVRATSVQGEGRQTTRSLQRVARLPLASVAAPGEAPTPVTSVTALANLVVQVGAYPGPVPSTVLQPWEGMTTGSVLRAAGAERPFVIPAILCRSMVMVGYVVSKMLRGRFDGTIRRVELMWFGQRQLPTWSDQLGLLLPRDVSRILSLTSAVIGGTDTRNEHANHK